MLCLYVIDRQQLLCVSWSFSFLTSADVNECLTPDVCAANYICFNTVGSYRCVCTVGPVSDCGPENPLNPVCKGVKEIREDSAHLPRPAKLRPIFSYFSLTFPFDQSCVTAAILLGAKRDVQCQTNYPNIVTSVMKVELQERWWRGGGGGGG